MPNRRTRPSLQVQQLEDRSVPTVFTVTSTADTIARDGHVTLREAITAANTHQASGDAPAGSYGVNTIRFAIPGWGVHTIYLRSALPTITGQIIIDGSTQYGYVDSPKVVLDGIYAGSYSNGLVLAGGYSTVRGLDVMRFHGSGVVLASAGNKLAGMYIGIDPSGYFDRGNDGDGVKVTGHGNTVGGYYPRDRVVISGNGGAGIDMTGWGSYGNLVMGDYIGTDATGFASVANRTGILMQAGANHNRIGGTATAARNVVTGNQVNEIWITGRGTSGNSVMGNFIGVDASGEAGALSGGDGVRIEGGATGNTIGGTIIGSGNLIGGAGHLSVYGVPLGAGIRLQGYGTTGNVIQGNWIGMDAAGLGRLQNMGGGIIYGNGATGNTIGGWTKAAHNVISDQYNTYGLATTNQILARDWYIHSIDFLYHPELLGGTFVG